MTTTPAKEAVSVEQIALDVADTIETHMKSSAMIWSLGRDLPGDWMTELRSITVASLENAIPPALTPEERMNIATGVPEGWKLVPVEPTEEMRHEGIEALSADTPGYNGGLLPNEVWSAMLAASPASPQVNPSHPSEWFRIAPDVFRDEDGEIDVTWDVDGCVYGLTIFPTKIVGTFAPSMPANWKPWTVVLPSPQVDAPAVDVEAPLQRVLHAIKIADGDTLTMAAGDRQVVWTSSGSWTGSQSVTLGDLRAIVAALTTSGPDLRTPATALVAALDEALPAIDSAIDMASIHGQPYTGPSLREPLEAVRDALTGGGE